MVATPEESLTSLKLLVCMAKADGVLHEKERASLEATLREVDLPGGADLEALLDEPGEVDTLLAEVTDDGLRDHIYSSMFAMANADGQCSSEEQALLDRMREAFGIPDAQHKFLERLFQKREDKLTPAAAAAQPFGGAERDDKVRAETRKTAIISALLGAFPVPGLAIATDLAVVGLQVALAKDIGRLWGQELDTNAAKGILAAFGVGTGARIAVTNLLKIFPVWGAAAGAAAAYASTYAIGSVITTHFERGKGLAVDELRSEFQRAEAEGKKQYQDNKDEIMAQEASHRERLSDLSAALKRGEIDQAAFERQAAALDV